MGHSDRLAATTALDWVRPELDAALWHARQAITAWSSAPAETVLAEAAERMQPAAGALQLLGLMGLGQVVGVIAQVLRRMAGSQVEDRAAWASLVQKGIDAVTDRLDAVDCGAREEAASLDALYLDLCRLAGNDQARAVDLYFVDCYRFRNRPPLAAGIMAKPQDAALRARRQYQAGLLSYLTGKDDGLPQMRQALVEMMAAETNRARDLVWWNAAGLIDGLQSQAVVPDRETKKLFSRVDLLLRGTAAGNEHWDERLLPEIVYVIAAAEPKTDSLREIQTHWELRKDLPVESATTAGAREIASPSDSAVGAPCIQLLDEHNRPVSDAAIVGSIAREMRSNLTKIEELLEAFFAQPRDIDPLKLIAPMLDPLQGALRFLEMADAEELLAECRQVLVNYNDLAYEPRGGEFELVAEAIGCLAFHFDNLQTDPGASIPKLMSLRRRFAEFATPSAGSVVEANATVLAEATVEMESPAIEPEAASRPIDTGAAIDLRDSLPAAPANEEAEAIDPELLSIFVLEAREVLQQIDQARQEPITIDALGEIRRGFHTLKGGGKMIGLTRFGEAAYLVEAELNHWIQEKKAPDSALAEFVRVAHTAHTAWIAQQESGGAMTPDPEVIAAARTTLQQQEVAAELSPDVPAAVVTEAQTESVADAMVRDSAPQAAELLISSETDEQGAAQLPVVIEIASCEATTSVIELAATQELAEPAVSETTATSTATSTPASTPAKIDASIFAGTFSGTSSGQSSARQLLDIYLQEAAHHGRDLRIWLESWRNDFAHPNEGFMRAAHTLASTSRTTGQTAIAQLAGAVELVVNELLDYPRMPPPDLPADVAMAVRQLEQMVACVTAGDPVPDSEDLAARLMAAGNLLAAERQTEIAPETGATAGEAMAAQASDDDLHGSLSPAITTAIPTIANLADVESSNASEPDGIAVLPDLAANSGDERRKFQDDLDTGLIPLFLEEAEDLVPQLVDALQRWIARHWDSDAIREMQRILHTLKGSARMAGSLRLGELIHTMETDLGTALTEGRFTREALADLEVRIDRIIDSIERLRNSKLREETQTTSTSSVLHAVRTMSSEERPTVAEETAPTQVLRTMFRLDSKSLDELIGLVGEIGLGRVRLDKDNHDLRRAIGEMYGDLQRLQRLLRDIEIQAESQLQTRVRQAEEDGRTFDPLELDRYTRFQELTRMMAESVNDLESRQQGMQQGLGAYDASMRGMVRANEDLQRRLLRLRTVRFQSITNRLYRVVRLAGKELGKLVHLEVRGGDLELDRGILDRLAAPLEHMLRNAVVHGIEAPEIRRLSSKREIGQLTIDLRHEDNDIAIALIDDGAGLDHDAIAARGRELGLIAAGVEPSLEEIRNLIFRPGFSTARTVDENAGRGVGLDVVQNEISALGGQVSLDSARGEGTRIVIRVPISSRVSDVLVVRVGSRQFAIPVGVIQQVVPQRTLDAATAVRALGEVVWHGESYRYHRLLDLLDAEEEPAEHKRAAPLLLLRSGGRRVAVEIEEVFNTRRVVVKQLSRQMASIQGLLGATILVSGEIVLVIDPVQMCDKEVRNDSASANATGNASAPKERTTAYTAMVVDDSVTVRKVVERVLIRDGYRVELARDGIEALEKLRDAIPDIMLVDIEMPRMDGYDLVKAVRLNPATSGVPVIMISSRAADKHRNHALSLGVNVYLGKPFRDDVLFSHMRQLLGTHSHEATAALA